MRSRLPPKTGKRGRKAKSVSAWEFTVKIPKKTERALRMKTVVKLSRFETTIDVMRFARYATHDFGVKDLRACVSDLSRMVLGSIAESLVEDGYLEKVSEKTYKGTEQLIEFFKEVA